MSNFFRIQYDESGLPSGATGGGYILSRGATTTARLDPAAPAELSTVVNGDSEYNARTTRRAVSIMGEAYSRGSQGLRLEQVVDTPIGSGFGASAASAVSAVYASAGVLGINRPKHELALYAHRAEILERTGLGTVSVAYDGVGAGAITVPGAPGVAQFLNVPVPEETRIVTACLAPFDKKDALNSESISRRIDERGNQALERFLADPKLDNLALQGEIFAEGVGLSSPEVRKLADIAKASGAEYASQNMIGYAIHSITDEDRSEKVVEALSRFPGRVRVDVFEVGRRRAGALSLSRRP